MNRPWMSRRGLLLTAAAGVAVAGTAKAIRCDAASSEGAGAIVPNQDALLSILRAGPGKSGGKTYRLAANSDFGTALIHNYDFRSNPITIEGQDGTRFQWLDFANSQGITCRNFNVYGHQAGVANASVAIHNDCGGLLFEGVTVRTDAPDGAPADGCGWFVRYCTNDIQIVGRRDAGQPDISGKGNAASIIQSSNVTLKDLTITNIGTDGILLAGVTNCTVDGCFGTDFHPSEGGHPDFVQGFRAYDGTPIANITVKDCGWMRGRGAVCQGYFFEDVDNLLIQNCWLYGGMTNSSAVARGKTATRIADCYFVGFPDYGSSITIRGGTVNASVTDTYVGTVNDYGADGANIGFSQSGNTRLREVKPGDFTGLDAWLSRHPTARARA